MWNRGVAFGTFLDSQLLSRWGGTWREKSGLSSIRNCRRNCSFRTGVLRSRLLAGAHAKPCKSRPQKLCFCSRKKQKTPRREFFVSCCGGGTCTRDLQVMSLASYYCSTPLSTRIVLPKMSASKLCLLYKKSPPKDDQIPQHAYHMSKPDAAFIVIRPFDRALCDAESHPL